MLKNHAAGELFKPSASEANAWTEGARFARANRGSLIEGRQSGFRHSGEIWIKINAEIPRFGFAVITEPLFIPDGSEWSEDEETELLGRFAFKATQPGDDLNWDSIYNEYRHPVILQEPSSYPDENGGLVRAVLSGLSYCKVTFSDPGAGAPDSKPTTCKPHSSNRAQCGTDMGQGPFKIIWMEEADNSDGFRWALVNVCSEYRIPLAFHANLDEDVDLDEESDVIPDPSIGNVGRVTVHFRFWGASVGDTIGAVWVPAENRYTAWAKTCENDTGSDDADGGNPAADGGATDGGDPPADGGDLDGGTP